MGNKHTAISRFENYGPPGRSGARSLIDADDKAAAPAKAIAEIRALLDTVNAGAVIPSRRIRQILREHGL